MKTEQTSRRKRNRGSLLDACGSPLAEVPLAKRHNMRSLHRRLATLSLLLIATLSGCAHNSGPSHRDALPLLGEVAFTGSHIIVKNGEPFVWNRATIRLNGGYVYVAEKLPRGGTSIPFSQFADPHGEPFKRGWFGVRSVEIDVPDVQDGKPGRYRW